MPAKLVRVRDLPDPDRTHETRTAPDGSTYTLVGRPVLLRCPACGGEYSATRGDYFLSPPETVMACRQGHRAVPLVLVTREVRYVPA